MEREAAAHDRSESSCSCSVKWEMKQQSGVSLVLLERWYQTTPGNQKRSPAPTNP